MVGSRSYVNEIGLGEVGKEKQQAKTVIQVANCINKGRVSGENAKLLSGAARSTQKNQPFSNKVFKFQSRLLRSYPFSHTSLLFCVCLFKTLGVHLLSHRK